jgi:hypothetical protein
VEGYAVVQGSQLVEGKGKWKREISITYVCRLFKICSNDETVLVVGKVVCSCTEELNTCLFILIFHLWPSL